MQKNKFLLSIFIVLFGWMISFNAFAQSDPVAMLENAANKMIAGLKANRATLRTQPQLVYSLANKYIVPYAALSQMSRSVLPPNIWNNATPAQRNQFQREFTKTLIRTYSSALASYQDQSIKFYPVRGGYQGKSSIEVNSEISSPSSGQSIRVVYHLIRAGSTWRLFDLSVEGVDMLDSFRSQFSDILSQGDMNQLLQRMSTHNQR